MRCCFSGMRTRRCVFDGTTQFHQIFFCVVVLSKEVLLSSYCLSYKKFMHAFKWFCNGGYIETAFINHYEFMQMIGVISDCHPEGCSIS